MQVGVPESMAVEMLLSMCGKADRIAFNRTFDQRIIRIALMRYGFPESVIEAWAEKDNHPCSMLMSKKIMGKQPKLIDAYKFFTGKELEDAHSAMADTMASMTVYHAALDYQNKAAA
jgi:DNA polymerase-3 subunit epsilon